LSEPVERSARGVSGDFELSKKLRPVLDPNSTKYPGRAFLYGRWMTQEQLGRYREYKRKISKSPEYVERRRERQRKRYANDEYRVRFLGAKRDWWRLNK
jgi:hypothetical protein